MLLSEARGLCPPTVGASPDLRQRRARASSRQCCKSTGLRSVCTLSSREASTDAVAAGSSQAFTLGRRALLASGPAAAAAGFSLSLSPDPARADVVDEYSAQKYVHQAM